MSELVVNQVAKRYGKKPVLTDVSLTLQSGGLYALLGRNGVGKSTLLNMINNRVLADRGQITLDGASVVDNEAAQNRIYLMNAQQLYPADKTVAWHMRTAGRMFGGFDDALAAHLVARFHLDATRKLRQLSTGFQTIAKLIIALCVPCDFILLDEPVLGLDAPNREAFYSELLATYAARPRTFVIATHLIEEIAGLVDHVFVIDQGRVSLDEPAERLQATGRLVSGPAASVTAWLGSAPRLHEETLGGLLTVATLAAPALPAPAEVSVSALDLQQLFIYLTREEDEGDAD